MKRGMMDLGGGDCVMRGGPYINTRTLAFSECLKIKNTYIVSPVVFAKLLRVI